MTVGEFNPGVIGISAPIFNRTSHILGSIGITANEENFNRRELDRIAAFVSKAARQVTERISVISSGTDRPPRAVG
jgi:DNA-binding IclR family transcriptional regulator